jgi:hypothetical protein
VEGDQQRWVIPLKQSKHPINGVVLTALNVHLDHIDTWQAISV